MMIYIPPFIIIIVSILVIGIAAIIGFSGRKKYSAFFLITTLLTVGLAGYLYSKSMDALSCAKKSRMYDQLYNDIILEKYDGIEPTDKKLVLDAKLKAHMQLDSLNIPCE